MAKHQIYIRHITHLVVYTAKTTCHIRHQTSDFIHRPDRHCSCGISRCRHGSCGSGNRGWGISRIAAADVAATESAGVAAAAAAAAGKAAAELVAAAIAAADTAAAALQLQTWQLRKWQLQCLLQSGHSCGGGGGGRTETLSSDPFHLLAGLDFPKFSLPDIVWLWSPPPIPQRPAEREVRD